MLICSQAGTTGSALEPERYLAPLEALGDSVLVVGDAATLKVTGTIPVGLSPDEIVADMARTRLWIVLRWALSFPVTRLWLRRANVNRTVRMFYHDLDIAAFIFVFPPLDPFVTPLSDGSCRS